MKTYPLEIESVGSDTYIVMSRGHHDLEQFMIAALAEYDDWNLGGPEHRWIKTVPCRSGEFSSLYMPVKEGTKGAWPATYCYEYGEGWKLYRSSVAIGEQIP
ncbi:MULTISPECIES: hypothetical protein [Pseudomonas]|uniref:hypothetical protein n=1 Tax=Pseudomonas TaxID=286 RepID=UPI00300155A4